MKHEGDAAVKIVHVFSDGKTVTDISGVKVPRDNDVYKVIKDYIRKNKKEEAK